MKKIGVIGLGRMGFGIATNLMNRKYDVIGYDVSEEARVRLCDAGGNVAENCAQAAEGVDALILVVFNADQVEEVLFKQSAVDHMRAGSAVVVMASVGQQILEAIAPQLAQRGIDLIDAPMKGSSKDAACGNLFLILSAPKPLIEKHRSLLESIGSTLYTVGEKPGMGQMAKTCVQSFFCLACEGACEIMALAKAAGLDLDVVYKLLCSTGASSDVFKTTVKFIGSRSFTGTGNPMSILKKDLGVAMKIASSYSLDLPALAGTTANVDRAMETCPEEDIWAAAKPIEESAQIKIELNV